MVKYPLFERFYSSNVTKRNRKFEPDLRLVQYTGYQAQPMQKTNMALLIQRLLFLGIILLLANHYVKSSPARIPVKDVKGKETSDTGHTDHEVRNYVVQSREEKAGKS